MYAMEWKNWIKADIIWFLALLNKRWDEGKDME